jgi:hypothetical protein
MMLNDGGVTCLGYVCTSVDSLELKCLQLLILCVRKWSNGCGKLSLTLTVSSVTVYDEPSEKIA